jgi:hypothetical protein
MSAYKSIIYVPTFEKGIGIPNKLDKVPAILVSLMPIFIGS